ncbi:MAG: AraC family transcriptional regulator, partial [Chitinophagaceae bacterium]
MKKITQYEGLYGQRGVGHARDYLFSELLETRSEFFDWKIKPHVHPDLYQIFFILKGNFEFFGSAASGLYKAPCLVFVPPGALHGFSYQAGTSGRIITWSETLMATLFPDGSPVLTQLSSVQVSTDSSFPFTSGKIAEQLLLLHEELFSDLAEKGEMLKVILKQVIISIYRLCFATIGNEIKAASASYRYYRKYQELVRKADAKYTVKNMAKQIGITPVHLNRICNEITGKPAGRILEESL